MTTDTGKIIEELLGDEATKQIIGELGIDGARPEDQAKLIALMWKNVEDQVLLEILKALPPSELGTFDSLLKKSDVHSIRQFLTKHIPDFDRFVRHIATVEYESTKTAARMRLQNLNR